MSKLPIFLLGLTLLAGAATAAEETATGSEATPGSTAAIAGGVAAELLGSMDREAAPCQDFYRYACGGWLDATQLPHDQARWARSFSVIREANREVVRQILEEAAADRAAAGDRRRIGVYFASCMDEAAVEKAGAKPLTPFLEAIAGVKDAASLLSVAGRLHRIGVDTLFDTRVFPDFKNPTVNLALFSQGGLGMPDRDYYVSEDPKKQGLMAAYEKHVARMLGLLGESTEAAAADAAQVVAFETALAGASRPRAEMRNPEKLYHKIDIGGLQELTPALPWDAYLKAIGHPDVVDVNVAVPEFYQALDKLVAASDPAVLRAYLRWHLVAGTAELLSQDFVTASFDFYRRTLAGQQEIQPRWKRCVDATERALGEAVGKLYVERRFPGDSKAKALEMIGDIEASFEAALPALAWMDDTTRQRALEKARAVSNKIGYPDRWRDYSSIDLAPHAYFRNAVAAQEFEFDRQARKIGKPVDRDEWRMTPQMVNAYYNPLQNEIAFPAGILQPPFFHRDFPAAMNYGAIGAVVGHELTHGFDDQGRKFAPDGELREWWEPAATERFEKQAQCVADQYSGYEVEPGVAVNGRLTLGENIADIGGLKEAYDAYQRWKERHGDAAPVVGGLSDDQLFFVAFAQVWCALATPEAERVQVTTDPHSPPRFRAIGAISDNPAFAAAFACEPGTPMSPKDRCEVW